MCGILGAFGELPKTIAENFQPALDTLRHRGPDSSGTWHGQEPSVLLGHRRLAIIDLTGNGAQPMVDPSTGNVITFNGEIYNFRELRQRLQGLGHVFLTSTDTEVILKAYAQWGTDAVSNLEGMFAFAIFDRKDCKIFLARDPAGEKPLFLSLSNRCLIIASELKAIFKLNAAARKIDKPALDHYFAFGWSPRTQSIVKGITKLPPGSAATFDLKRHQLDTWTYYSLPETDYSPNASMGELTDQLEELLSFSVRSQLFSDAPLAVLLSGGLDSSIITALAARHTSRLKTFCITQPNTPRLNESRHAELIARHFGTDHTSIEVGVPDPSILDKLAYHYDDPIADTSMIPTFLVCEAISRECKVGVGGDGGDEVFGGYKRYNSQLRLISLLGWLPVPARQHLARLISRLLPIGTQRKGLIRILESCFPMDGVPASYRLGASERAKLFCENGFSSDSEHALMALLPQFATGLDRLIRLDFISYLPEDLLVKVDRASMACSLEVRAPLLATRILNFMFKAVPSRFKATTNDRKVLLKSLAGRILPKEFALNRKQGFSVPCDDWLQTPEWRAFTLSTLEDADKSIFNALEIRRLINSLSTGNPLPATFLLAVVFFERWRRIHGITL